VIAHSVANELSPRPDVRRNTGRFLVQAARVARRLDPTLPVAVDIVGRTPFGKQRTYRHFDALGINQYFGWYPRAGPLGRLARYLRHTRARYRRQALVVTEFGAEAPPELADGPAGEKGTYAFQAAHAERTLRVIDRLPFLSGAIYWTLREFVAYPGWTGGVPADRRRGPPPNSMHNKGLITYQGQRKPAFEVVRRRFAATPLYGRGRR
jgi:beta-glucuronidase